MTSLGRRTDVSHGEAAAPVEVHRWRAFWLLAAAFLMTIIDLTMSASWRPRAACSSGRWGG